jgi:hypothetical protein
MNTSFVDRNDILSRIISLDWLLMCLIGEGGIGKSALLDEAQSRLQDKKIKVIKIDFQKLETNNIYGSLINAFFLGGLENLQESWESLEVAAGKVVQTIKKLSEKEKVVILYDTTETLQENKDFWKWFESNLAARFLIEGIAHQVFAGRQPPPWYRFELRISQTSIELKPLDPKGDARTLAGNLLKRQRTKLQLSSEEQKNLVDTAISYSQGHPGLTIEIVTTLSAQKDSEPDLSICKEVLEPYITKNIFTGIEPEWQELLWWLSPFEWFNPSLIQEYLKEVAKEVPRIHEIISGKQDYFFSYYLNRLVTQFSVVWRDVEQGDRFSGNIRKFMLLCLKQLHPEQYTLAVKTAEKTLRYLAEEYFPEDHPDRVIYQNHADQLHAMLQ